MKPERDAVAGCHGRVRRFPEDLTGATGRQQDRPSPNVAPAATFVEEPCADSRALVDQHFGHERMLDGHHGRHRANTLPQDTADLAAGRIARVQDTPHGMRRLAPEGGLSVRAAIDAHPPVEQLADVHDTLLDEHPDRRFVAQSVAGANRVFGVEGRAVVVAQGRGDAALRVSCVALAGLGLGENRDASGSGQPDGGSQTGDPAADDKEVRAVGGQSRWMLS